MQHEPEPDSDQSAHLLSRRALLRGAAGLGLVAATGTLLPACGRGGGGESRAERLKAEGPPETTSIRLFSLPPANCIAPQYVAESFLREEGFTDVQYVKLAPKDAMQRIVAGEVDFSASYVALLTPFIADGAPLTMLGGLHLGCWQVVATATSDIKSMRDFKGKTVAIVGPKFTDGVFMALTLANVGLDINKDVKVVNHPPSEHERLLSSGEVDAVVSVPPFSTNLRAKGIGRVVINSVVDPPWSNYYCCTAFANRNWMDKHPMATKRALRAMLKATDVVAKDVEGTARFMVDKGYTNNYDYTCDLLREMPYDVWRDYNPADSVRFYALRLKEAGLIDKTPEQILERGTDFRYLDQLKRELKET